MNTQTRKIPPEQQRDALKESEHDATRDEPQNFREHANEDKIIEIGPDVTDAPIQGIDPIEHGKRER